MLKGHIYILKEKSERIQTRASPRQGEGVSKRLGGTIGCKYKTS